MVTISEGARMIRRRVVEYGEADAYGHRKLGGIGLVTGELLKQLTGEDIVYQQLAYLMRSGAPDALDLMVAVNYANLAIDPDRPGRPGPDGGAARRHLHLGPDRHLMQGTKRVDVDALYDEKRYRPLIRQVDGKPMFLY